MLTHYSQTQSTDQAIAAARESNLNGPVYDNLRDAHRALSYYRNRAITDDQALFWAAVEAQDLFGDGRYL